MLIALDTISQEQLEFKMPERPKDGKNLLASHRSRCAGRGIAMGLRSSRCSDCHWMSTDLRPRPALRPLGVGPLELSAIYCSQLRPSGFPQSPPALSPDGRSFFSFDNMKGLSLGAFAAGSPLLHFPGPPVVGVEFRPAPFAWSKDSRFVFG